MKITFTQMTSQVTLVSIDKQVHCKSVQTFVLPWIGGIDIGRVFKKLFASFIVVPLHSDMVNCMLIAASKSLCARRV